MLLTQTLRPADLETESGQCLGSCCEEEQWSALAARAPSRQAELVLHPCTPTCFGDVHGLSSL